MIGTLLAGGFKPGDGTAIAAVGRQLVFGWMPGTQLIGAGSAASVDERTAAVVGTAGGMVIGQFAAGSAAVPVKVAGTLFSPLALDQAIRVPVGVAGRLDAAFRLDGATDAVARVDGDVRLLRVLDQATALPVRVDGVLFAGVSTGFGKVAGRFIGAPVGVRWVTSNVKGRSV